VFYEIIASKFERAYSYFVETVNQFGNKETLINRVYP